MSAPDDMLRALVREELRSLLVQLAEALSGSQAPYSTRKGGEVPDEFRGRRKAWLATAPTIPGAVPLGKRWCLVPRDVYRSWLASQAPAKPTTRKPWHPADELPALRLVAKGGR